MSELRVMKNDGCAAVQCCSRGQSALGLRSSKQVALGSCQCAKGKRRGKGRKSWTAEWLKKICDFLLLL